MLGWEDLEYKLRKKLNYDFKCFRIKNIILKNL